MSLITDWLMVAITAIYTIATLLITFSNIKSATASKNQLEESIRQFDEMQRIKSLPFLQLESKEDEKRDIDYLLQLPTNNDYQRELFSKIFVLRNIGNGTAMNIVYSWECKEKEISIVDYPTINAIRYGDSYKVKLIMNKTDSDVATIGTLIFSYQDLINNEYEQNMYLSCKGCEVAVETDSPRLSCEQSQLDASC